MATDTLFRLDKMSTESDLGALDSCKCFIPLGNDILTSAEAIDVDSGLAVLSLRAVSTMKNKLKNVLVFLAGLNFNDVLNIAK